VVVPDRVPAERMINRNWTLIIGCTAFIVVGLIAIVTGSSVTTAAFRAVVASFVGGLLGFSLDYFAAQAPTPPPSKAGRGAMGGAGEDY
jgi:membrane protein YqaA with SNARE-associated domain